jgi:N-acetylmuramoyl-L-alanine amidase
MQRILLWVVALTVALAWCGGLQKAAAHAPERRQPVVVLDPGHTPETIGAVSADGALAEHTLTLALAQKTAAILQQRGITVYLTRLADGSLALPLRDENGNGLLDDHEYLQPRTDLANHVHADVLISLHFNGSPDPAHAGASVYYAGVGPYVHESVRLAIIMQRSLVAGLRRSGYNVADLGALSDAGLKDYGTLYSLGQNDAFARQGRWPGVVIEPLFLTNAGDAAFLQRLDALDVLAQACAQAISEYLGVGCCRKTWAAE